MPARAVETIARLAEMPSAIRGIGPNRWDAEQRESVAALSGELALRAMLRADSLGDRAASPEQTPSAARSLAGAAKDLAIVAGILTDKAQLLAGQPTVRAERVDTAELMARLSKVLTGRAMPMALATGTEGTDSPPSP